MMMTLLRLLSLLGLKSRLRPPDRVFFRGGGRGVAGFVDSGPKTLVPSASNRSTPEWTRVDSRHGRAEQERLRASAPQRRDRGFGTCEESLKSQAVPRFRLLTRVGSRWKCLGSQPARSVLTASSRRNR